MSFKDASSSDIQAAVAELRELQSTIDGSFSGLSGTIHTMADGGDDGVLRGQTGDGSCSNEPTEGGNDAKRELDKRISRMHKVFTNSRGRYVSDVIPCGNEDIALKIAKTIQSELERGRSRDEFVLVSIDAGKETHIHLVHDCAFSISQQRCRCAYIQKVETFYGVRRNKRSSQMRPFGKLLTLTDCYRILCYFGEGRRYIAYLRIQGNIQSTTPIDQSVGLCGLEGCGPESPLSEEQIISNPEFRREGQKNYESYRSFRRSNGSKAQPKQGYFAAQRETILRLLENNPCYPPKGLLSTSIWLRHPDLAFLNETEKTVQQAFQNWNKTLCSFSLKDYHNMYASNKCNYIFGAGFNKFNDYYYTVDESEKILMELLNFQYNDNLDDIIQFLSDLYVIIEKRIPKLNTICIVSQPSAGKNFFFDALLCYLQNVGHLGILNRYNSFPFQDIIDRRVILWNEPNFSSDFYEPLKMLLGGDVMTVNVKYKEEAPVYRTPIIILSNNVIDCFKTPAFLDRVSYHTWYTAPFLKNYNKKPHPMAIYTLFDKLVDLSLYN